MDNPDIGNIGKDTEQRQKTETIENLKDEQQRPMHL
jgi:hypothetical protein